LETKFCKKELLKKVQDNKLGKLVVENPLTKWFLTDILIKLQPFSIDYGYVI